jgi:hypothetical protein
MALIQYLYAPIVVSTDTPTGQVPPGTIVTISSNVPATALYTLDGSRPISGQPGTFSAPFPFSLQIDVSTVISVRAFRASDPTKISNTTQFAYTVSRVAPLEVFRDTFRMFKLLQRYVVDYNFYLGGGLWTVPQMPTTANTQPYTMVVRNPESKPVIARVLLNGTEVTPGPNYPSIPPLGSIVVPVPFTSPHNVVVVETDATIGS